MNSAKVLILPCRTLKLTAGYLFLVYRHGVKDTPHPFSYIGSTIVCLWGVVVIIEKKYMSPSYALS
jgi:hypothetical protein